MLTATLISIIASLVIGGHKSPFFTPNLAKRIKKFMKNLEKRTDVLAVIKATNTAQDRFLKRVKSYKKMIASLANDKETTSQEFSDLFKGLLLDDQQMQKKVIDARFLMISEVTAAEFDSIVDKDYVPSAKSFEKINKSLEGHIQKMLKAAEKSIDDQVAMDGLKKAINEFQISSKALRKSMEHMDVKDNEALGRYDATPEELQKIADSNLRLRTDFYSGFINLHQSLASSTSEKQWKAASKALKELIK